MPTSDDVIALATTDIGVVESPPNSNRTKFGRWYGLDGQPYCAMAVSYWFHMAGLPLPASTSKGFAYTPSGAVWFQQRSRWTTKPARGHVVFFDFPGDGVNRISHVGLVEAVRADGSIVTIEANTSPGNGGSQRDGGGVYRRIRSTGIVGYGVPAYTASPNQEDFMATLSEEEKAELIAGVKETRQIVNNLQAVATRDIDTLRPLLAEVLEAVKANPSSGSGGPGGVTADALADELAARLAG